MILEELKEKKEKPLIVSNSRLYAILSFKTLNSVLNNLNHKLPKINLDSIIFMSIWVR